MVGGDASNAFPSARLLIPIIPLAMVAIGYMMQYLWQRLDKKLFSVALLVITIISLMAYRKDAIMFFYYCNPKSILTSRPTFKDKLRYIFIPRRDLYEAPAIARWINSQVKTNDYVALSWAGLSYYINAKTIDMMGLNDVHIAHLKKIDFDIDVKMDACYVVAKNPKLVFINVNQDVALGRISFEEGGGWLTGDRELLKLLRANLDYELVTDAPTNVVVYRRK